MHRTEAGPSFLYTLNRDHLMAPAVDVMASARWELVGRLRGLMDAWQVRPFHASLFGSAARGEGNPASDIDLLVVRATDTDDEDSTWRQQLDDLAERTLSWTGNDAGIVELAAADIPKLLEDRPPVLDEIKKDGIDLAGLPIRQLLRGES